MPARIAKPFALALFWLGIQAVWGALLGISLQSRATELLKPLPAIIPEGWLAASGAVVAAIVQVLVGFWSDARRARGSRRLEFYTAGAFGGAAAIAWFYAAPSFVQLCLAFAAVQATLNLAIGPYQAIIPDFVERMRTGIASSWMAGLQSLGNAAGALAASFIGDWRALAATLDGLLLATWAATAAHARGLQPQPIEAERPRPRVTRPFVDLFVSRVLVYVGFYTLLNYLFFYVSAMLGATGGDARRSTGILIVVFTLVGTLGAALAGRPSDRLDKRLVATLGGAGFIAALALFVVAHGFGGAAAAAVVAGVGWGIFLVADWAIACRILPPSAMAAAMGIWNLAIVLPQIAAPAITTLVLQGLRFSTGPQAPRIAFLLALAETLVGVAWLWRIPRCAIEE